MYGVGDSHRDSSTNTNILFSSTTFKDGGEFIKNPDLYQQQQQQSSALMRYSSAPSSFLASLVDGCDDFLNSHHHHHQEQSSSSPDESELFARLVPNDDSDPPQHNLQQFGSTGLKQEETQQEQEQEQEQDRERDQYSTSTFQTDHHHQIHQRRDLGNHSSLSNNSCSNLLLRQSSSPAGFFSDLATENGFGVMRDVGNFGVGNGTNGKSGPTSRLNNHINFSSGPSSGLKFMPPIVENGNESIEAGSLENGNLGNGNSNKRYFVPSFQNDPWNGSGFTGLKRSRDDDDEKKFSGFNALENQNGNSRNFSTGLTHHLSLPKTSSAEMATMEKFVQFQQDSVPCKIRAKRGFATHPRSIAERVRRTRISERMRKLQELFPNMDKQTNTADMLDLAVEYIKDLQKQVKTLTDTRSKCTCSSQQKQSSNPTL